MRGGQNMIVDASYGDGSGYKIGFRVHATITNNS